MDHKEWMDGIRKRDYPWMNDTHFECFEMLCDIFGGAHHVDGKVKQCSTDGIECNLYNPGFSTFDFNRLTGAVLMAHDRCIRFALSPSGPGRIRAFFHKRNKRDGDIMEKHPTIETAIESYKKNYSQNNA